MIVVAVVGLVSAISMPHVAASRRASQRSTCIANLKQIQDAKDTWCIENRQARQIDGTDVLTRYMVHPPHCPAGGTYAVNGFGANPSCSLNVEPHGHTLAP